MSQSSSVQSCSFGQGIRFVSRVHEVIDKSEPLGSWISLQHEFWHDPQNVSVDIKIREELDQSMKMWSSVLPCLYALAKDRTISASNVIKNKMAGQTFGVLLNSFSVKEDASGTIEWIGSEEELLKDPVLKESSTSCLASYRMDKALYDSLIPISDVQIVPVVIESIMDFADQECSGRVFSFRERTDDKNNNKSKSNIPFYGPLFVPQGSVQYGLITFSHEVTDASECDDDPTEPFYGVEKNVYLSYALIVKPRSVKTEQQA